jgi:hypothetical protein
MRHFDDAWHGALQAQFVKWRNHLAGALVFVTSRPLLLFPQVSPTTPDPQFSPTTFDKFIRFS